MRCHVRSDLRCFANLRLLQLRPRLFTATVAHFTADCAYARHSSPGLHVRACASYTSRRWRGWYWVCFYLLTSGGNLYKFPGTLFHTYMPTSQSSYCVAVVVSSHGDALHCLRPLLCASSLHFMRVALKLATLMRVIVRQRLWEFRWLATFVGRHHHTPPLVLLRRCHVQFILRCFVHLRLLVGNCALLVCTAVCNGQFVATFAGAWARLSTSRVLARTILRVHLPRHGGAPLPKFPWRTLSLSHALAHRIFL